MADYIAPHGTDLPPEIIWMIAEDAASDSKAIQTLSSLNKTWYTTIQPILYRRISIEGTRHEKYRDFETLIQARPEVATWLQELSFLFGFCCPHPRGLLYNGYMCDFMDNMPEKLVNLRSIELVESMTLTGDQEESYDLRRCLAEFHSVRELRFYMGLVDQNMLKILTYAFPNLRVLEVSRCIVSPRINQDERFSRGTAIQRLEFYDSLSNEREFLSWLGEANKKDELKSIALSTNDRDAVRTIGSFIRKYGGSLEELELLLLTPELKGKERFEAGCLRYIDLSSCHNLRTIHLQDAVNPSALNALKQLPNPAVLEQVIFAKIAHPSQESDVNTPRWIDEELASPRYEKLREVVFSRDEDVGQERTLSQIVPVFPLLHSRGLLRVGRPYVRGRR